MRVVSADRSFLGVGAAGAPGSGGHLVVLHDYRDVSFLKKLTAGGIFGTLMSSSALAYAISMNLSLAACGFMFVQTGSVALLLTYYLRTYVARAVLDPRRARLTLTGCSFFGEPMVQEQQVPLALIQPGASLCENFIKFQLRGSAADPARWIWYRIPRARFDGTAVKAGASVGVRASELSASAQRAPATGGASATQQGATPPGQRFLGAGLGGGVSAQPPGERRPTAPSAPRAPQPPRSAPAGRSGDTAAGSPDDGPLSAMMGRRLTSVKLKQGLPVDLKEEQKIIDLLEEPDAYAAFSGRI